MRLRLRLSRSWKGSFSSAGAEVAEVYLFVYTQRRTWRRRTWRRKDGHSIRREGRSGIFSLGPAIFSLGLKSAWRNCMKWLWFDSLSAWVSFSVFPWSLLTAVASAVINFMLMFGLCSAYGQTTPKHHPWSCLSCVPSGIYSKCSKTHRKYMYLSLSIYLYIYIYIYIYIYKYILIHLNTL